MSAFSPASARFSKMRIPFVNNLLDGDLCKIALISTFSFFLIVNHDFIISTDFTTSQLQTQQEKTSQIRSHIEYLIQTYYIFVFIL